MKIRQIKPEFWTSEQVVDVSRDARLLFIGLWNLADDGGRHPNKPRRIKMALFPADDDTQVERWLAELLDVGLLSEYEVDGKRYLQITGWHHQSISRPYYRYPTPEGEVPEGFLDRQRRFMRERDKEKSKGYGQKALPEQCSDSDQAVPEQCPGSDETVPRHYGKGDGKGDGNGNGNGEGLKREHREDLANARSSSGDPAAPASPTPKRKRQRNFTEDDMRAATYIWQCVLRASGGEARQPNLDRWADDVRLMRERDNRGHAEICETMRWAAKDGFWQSNVLSVRALRKNYDRLRMQMRGAMRSTEDLADEAAEQATRVAKLIKGGETR